MSMINRRLFLKSAGGLTLGTLGLGSYAFAIEPGFMLEHTSYALTPAQWPQSLPLRIAVLADIHACEPWMSAGRIAAICEATNQLNPDLIVILGDFNAGHGFVSGPVMPEQWAQSLAVLRAPLGVYAILGNHDWWHGALPNMRSDNAEAVRRNLTYAGIRVLENQALKIRHHNHSFWLAGLGDQMVHRLGKGVYEGRDDLEGTLRQVSDDAPVILLAHEPFIFSRVPAHIALTLCGHTHGGQVVLPFVGTPFLGDRFQYIYGHVNDHGRHMIISAGLGTSIAPVRFGRPPEIVSIHLGAPALSAAAPHIIGAWRA
jgi:predicted MPP superfamily phosphohydrolase